MAKGTARVFLMASVCWLGCGPDQGEYIGGRPGGPGGPRGMTGTGAANGSGGGGTGSNADGGLAGEYFGAPLKPGQPSNNSNGEEACALKKFSLNRKPPELMLVLDRSGSMQRDAAGNSPGANYVPPSRWAATTMALDTVLQQTQAGVAWGLQMFPYPPTTTQTDPLACKGDAPPTNEPAFGAHAAIMSIVNMSAPPLDIGTTPTRAAIATTVAYLKTRTTENPKYILLATDGEPNECADPNNPATVRSPTANADATVEAVKAANDAGFPVFVVGVAINQAANTMNRLAVAGGRPQAGATQFYSANNTVELQAALTSIASAVADCTFVLGTAPPVPDQVAVDVGNVRVRQDPTHADGWDFSTPDKKTIVLYGPLCDDVKSGKVTDATISWTCPGSAIP